MIRDKIKYVTLCRLFNDAVVKYGDLPMQYFKSGPDQVGSFTYSEIGAIVKELTAGLMSLNLEKGERVAIMSHNCPQWLWSDFSILNAAAVTVTVYPTVSLREMKHIVNDSGARMIFVRDLEGVGRVQQAIEEMPSLEKIIVMEDCELPNNPDFISLNALRNLGNKYLQSHPYQYEKRWQSVELWDWATIIYTSGTTGQAKGVIHTHQSIIAANAQVIRNFVPNGINFVAGQDVILSFLPLSHSYERQCGMMVSINFGISIAYAEKPSTIIQDLQLFKPTLFMSVPRIFERIYVSLRDLVSSTPEGAQLFERVMDIGKRVIESRADKMGFVDMGFDIDLTEGLDEELKQEYLWADQTIFSRIRSVLGGRYRASWSASAALPAELCQAFMAMGIRIIEGYGLTETCNTLNLNNLRKVLPGSIGPTLAGVTGRIAADGEWQVKGDSVFLGYFNNPEATRDAFTEDGYFKTGDIVEELTDGYLKVVDRKKSIMVLDTGKNVPRAKVENNFTTSRYIDQVCAVADEKKFVSALIVPKFDFFIQYFNAKGIPYDESKLVFAGEGLERTCIQVGDDFAQQEELRKLVESEIACANDNLESFESIKKFKVLNRRFLENLDEVTPTLKLKHRKIINNCTPEINSIYSD